MLFFIEAEILYMIHLEFIQIFNQCALDAIDYHIVNFRTDVLIRIGESYHP